MDMTAMRTAMPKVTCGKMTLCAPSATRESISTPRLIGPGCMTMASGLASASFKGEPRLLNVWASWCAACPQEHPVLERIAAEGFPVYGIAWKDKPEDSRAFLARYGDPYSGMGSDFPGRTAIDLGVTGAPETFVVDKKGRVRFKQIGPISPEVWEGQIRPLMQKLRAEA
jgi:cytochrome c biogenesis protein CcmG/thiol:disulfide interchange protein DsbE